MRRPFCPRAPLRWLASVALCVALIGCDRVTPAEIEAWKTAEGGIERLVAVTKDGKRDPALRAEAAAALVEAGRAERMQWAISGLTLDDRARLVPLVVPRLAPAATRDDDQGRETRFALYTLRLQSTTPEAVKAVDGALLPALERELRAGRTDSGRTDLATMLKEIGRPMTGFVTTLLEDPATPLEPLVGVLEKIGDAPAREAGGTALVKRARASSPIPQPLWGLAAGLGGKDVSAFLVETVKAGGEHAEPAAAALLKLRRDPDLLPFALATAKDASVARPVREHAIDLARRIGGEDARKGLIDLAKAEREQDLRFRLYGEIIKIGPEQAIPAVLEAWTAPLSTKDLREKIVQPLVTMGFDARPGIWKCFESKSALARLVAVWALEKSGWKSDAEATGKLAADKGAVKLSDGSVSVGAEARRVTAELQKQAG